MFLQAPHSLNWHRKDSYAIVEPNNLLKQQFGLFLREMWSIDCSCILLCIHVILMTALVTLYPNPVPTSKVRFNSKHQLHRNQFTKGSSIKASKDIPRS